MKIKINDTYVSKTSNGELELPDNAVILHIEKAAKETYWVTWYRVIQNEQ